MSERHAELLERLTRATAEAAESRGVEVVELTLRGSGHRRLLRVDIDRAGARGVDHGDCQAVSSALAEILERDDLIPSSYVLEVSSPGLDRPIRTPDDFRRNAGRRVEVQTSEPVNGRRELHGELLGLEDGIVRLREPSGEVLEIRLELVGRIRQALHF